MSEHNVEAVRSLWRAFGSGGIERVLKIADPDVEWIPRGGGGRVYRGHEGLRDYMTQTARTTEDGVSANTFTDLGDHVLVYGHFRDRPIFWLYTFRDELLVRFEAFDDQHDAIRAARRGAEPAHEQ